MNNIELYIDGVLADYQNLESLPLSFEVAVDNFFEIGSSKGISISNTINSIALPATKRNIQLFDLFKRQRTGLSFVVFNDGQQVFTGSCKVISELSKYNQPKQIQLDVYGGNADVFTLLESVSLRELDLGTQDWTDTAIINSWTGNCDTYSGIFAPCLYGKLTDDGVNYNNHKAEDLRYHIYFEAILKGIEQYIGYQFISTFRSTDLWRRCVYLFGVGDLMEIVFTPNTQQDFVSNLSGATNMQINVASTGVYQATINIPDAPNIDEVILNTPNFTKMIPYQQNQNGLQSTTENFDVMQGNIITITCRDNLQNPILVPHGSSVRIVKQRVIQPNTTIEVASCLHDEPVKKWLKSIFQLFNLCMSVNPVTKQIILEPRFDYGWNGTRYQGFYKKPTDATIYPLAVDTTRVKRTYDSGIHHLTLALQKSEDEIEKYLLQQADKKILIPFSSKTKIGDSANQNKEIINELFTNTYYGISFDNAPYELPIQLPEDFKLGDSLPTPTFESAPRCALVSRANNYIKFNNTTYAVPALSNYDFSFPTPYFSLTFSDITINRYGQDYTIPGLTSIFYHQYFAILRRMEKVRLKVNIDTIDIKQFEGIQAFENGWYLLLGIDDYNIVSPQLSEVELVKWEQVRDSDLTETVHSSNIVIHIT